MFCNKCGQKVSEDSLFCSKCGNNINSINNEEAPILTGKINRKTKLSVFYIISTFIMGGFLIPIFMMLALSPKLHTSIEGFWMASPGIFLILGYGVAVLLFSHFFATTMISKILVKITFVTYMVGIVLMAINIPFLLFALISIDFNFISDIWPGQTGLDHEIISDSFKRSQVFGVIVLTIVFMGSYLLIDAILLKRWLKNEKGLNFKEGLRSLFKPKFNKGIFISTIKSIK